jgi:hypothetical protein
MAHTGDAQILEQTGNSGRFFTEHRQVAWVLLLGTVLWGVYGYRSMPQRKDPDIPVRVAVAVCPWPGGTAVDVEELVTRPIEQKIAENTHIHPASASEYGLIPHVERYGGQRCTRLSLGRSIQRGLQ